MILPKKKKQKKCLNTYDFLLSGVKFFGTVTDNDLKMEFSDKERQLDE